jgi:cyclopropane fatty-acyl-phospholipid synthase-like methyltransferase
MNKEPQKDLKKLVEKYYEKTHFWYRLLWYRKDLAIHYGFWDTTTRSQFEAVINENRFLAEQAQITQNDHVLDAGCGVGGSAIWLAKTIGCHVLGITISPSQVKAARKNAVKNGVSELVSFELIDYMSTSFPYSTFDVVWGIESFCHAPSKRALFKELWRILKPGGRIVIADGFQKREPHTLSEQKTLLSFFNGLAVYDIPQWDEYEKILHETGFKNIRRWDKTDAVRPSAQRIFWIGVFFTTIVPFFYFTRYCGMDTDILIGNWHAAFAQRKALQGDLCLYGVYYGEKP